jgi:hypothetical protein
MQATRIPSKTSVAGRLASSLRKRGRCMLRVRNSLPFSTVLRFCDLFLLRLPVLPFHCWGSGKWRSTRFALTTGLDGHASNPSFSFLHVRALRVGAGWGWCVWGVHVSLFAMCVWRLNSLLYKYFFVYLYCERSAAVTISQGEQDRC